VPPLRKSEAGVRFQWLEGDLRARRQQRGGLLRDLIDYLAYSRGAVHTLWRTDDPVPAVRFGARFAMRPRKAPRRTESREYDR
jgi:hypothetical protein